MGRRKNVYKIVPGIYPRTLFLGGRVRIKSQDTLYANNSSIVYGQVIVLSLEQEPYLLCIFGGFRCNNLMGTLSKSF